MNGDPTLSARQVATRLGISLRSVYRLRDVPHYTRETAAGALFLYWRKAEVELFALARDAERLALADAKARVRKLRGRRG